MFRGIHPALGFIVRFIESYNERSDECANMAPTGDGKDATGTGTGSGTE